MLMVFIFVNEQMSSHSLFHMFEYAYFPTNLPCINPIYHQIDIYVYIHLIPHIFIHDSTQFSSSRNLEQLWKSR